LEIASSRMGHLWDGLSSAYDALGFARAVGGDEVFRQLVLARIIEPICGEEYGVAAVAAWLDERGLRWWSVVRARRC
jgi:hypothetical protein